MLDKSNVGGGGGGDTNEHMYNAQICNNFCSCIYNTYTYMDNILKIVGFI